MHCVGHALPNAYVCIIVRLVGRDRAFLGHNHPTLPPARPSGRRIPPVTPLLAPPSFPKMGRFRRTGRCRVCGTVWWARGAMGLLPGWLVRVVCLLFGANIATN